MLNNLFKDIDDAGSGNIVTPNNVCETGTGAAATVCADSPTPPFDIDHEVEEPKQTVNFNQGSWDWELHGNGTTEPYFWVWVPGTPSLPSAIS